MESVHYNYRFHEAIQHAFAATNPAVRAAYFELASFYREKLGSRLQMSPPADLLKRLRDGAAVEDALGRRQ